MGIVEVKSMNSGDGQPGLDPTSAPISFVTLSKLLKTSSASVFHL